MRAVGWGYRAASAWGVAVSAAGKEVAKVAIANARVAKDEVANVEKLILSERDSLRVLDLLEHPPAPSEQMRRAARADFILK